MRVAWLSPLARRTGISKYSLAVAPEIARHFELDLWSPATDDDYTSSGCASLTLDKSEATLRELEAYDLVVCNMGNNYQFHGEIYHVLRRLPGIAIIHDKRMPDFFYNMWVVAENDLERYVAMMSHYYGRAGESAVFTSLKGDPLLNQNERCPLVEALIWNSVGVVVHSKDAQDAVSRYGDLLPIATLPLPFELASVPDVGVLPGRIELVPDDGRLLIVSSGGVFEQKRLESVIGAIALDPVLRRAVRLVIVGGGRPEYFDLLRSQVVQHGLEDCVLMTGRVDDATMYGWIRAADVAVNLRYPSTESASMSLVEQLSFGKPVVVSETSYYAELPDAFAVKVPVGRSEVQAIASALRRLAEDEPLRRSMGAAASSRYRESHSAQAYAERFCAFAEEVVGSSR